MTLPVFEIPKQGWGAPRTKAGSAGASLALLFAAALSVLNGGCAGHESSPSSAIGKGPLRDTWRAKLDDAIDLWGSSTVVVGRRALGLAALAAADPGHGQAVADARRAAIMARVLALREPDAGWIDNAHRWLEQASRRAALPGACPAAMELSRLLARDQGQLQQAYAVAWRTRLRFASIDPSCAELAGQLCRNLQSWAPSRAVLAAIEADPSGDDPLPPSIVDPAPSLPGDSDSVPGSTGELSQWSRWASEQAEREPGQPASGTLQAVTVFGQQGEPSVVRVSLTFDRLVAFEHGESPAEGERPRQTWLELPGVVAGEQLARLSAVGAAGLLAIGVDERPSGPGGIGGLRVRFDLSDETRLSSFVLPDPFRIVLDFDNDPPSRPGPIRLVVLDPGHGGDDFGARSEGLRESDLTLDLAFRVRALLRSALPGVQTILTRERDDFVSLEQRTALANAVSADLFISLHLNAADEVVERGGVTTFVLDTSNDRQARRLAARENGSRTRDVGQLARLLASLHREGQLEASLSLAERVHQQTLRAGRQHLPRLHDRHVRRAMFHVLVGARMPAILLEASFLSQPDERRALRTESYRQALAHGITEGIVRFAR